MKGILRSFPDFFGGSTCPVEGVALSSEDPLYRQPP